MIAVISLSIGEYHCPITFRVFNENSHIVAIRTSGNVYSYEVIITSLLNHVIILVKLIWLDGYI